MNSVFFPWKEEYATGIDVIDSQHKRLIELIDKLYNTFMQRSEKEHMQQILKEILDYASYHFDTEATLMRKYNFPKTIEHTAMHDAFAATAIEFRHKHRHGGVITSSLMNFLRTWLNDHILKADREYIPYIKKEG
ncbi:MAG: hemerythrin family protein [Bacteroidales bacterium]|nr:hemerythrin family protein [Bacteroidales bacterium]